MINILSNFINIYEYIVNIVNISEYIHRISTLALSRRLAWLREPTVANLRASGVYKVV